MNLDDIPAAMRLKGDAGWNQTEADWRPLITASPDGCFVAVPGVCVIDEDFARKYFGHQNPIGKRLNFEQGYKQLEIVGVVGHVKEFGLDESGKLASYPQFYTADLQLPDNAITTFASFSVYIIRTQGPVDAFVGSIRSAIL
jgi:hypothetical protein